MQRRSTLCTRHASTGRWLSWPPRKCSRPDTSPLPACPCWPPCIGARRHAALERDALDVADAGHRAFAFGRVGLDQLIGQVARARRRHGQLRAGDFRTVLGLPGGRRSEVGADLLAAAIIEHRFRADEGPFGLAGGVGLVAAFVGDLARRRWFPARSCGRPEP